MVLCWIALPIFALLGIVSAKYRKLTVESLKCIWRTTTLRPCQSSLDEQLRSNITGALMHRWPAGARFFYNNYKFIAVVILILMLASTYFTIQGVYNYWIYGNCNGPNSSALCILSEVLGNSTAS